MRPIDADALKRRAQKVATEAWKMKIKAEVETVLNQFIDWIDEAPTIQAEPHWIPMTEKLPEVKQKVLVQYPDGSMATKRCNDAGHLTWFYANAVAWKPAPESYKGMTK